MKNFHDSIRIDLRFAATVVLKRANSFFDGALGALRNATWRTNAVSRSHPCVSLFEKPLEKSKRGGD